MSIKKLPWLSLALLLVTQSTLGWLLSAFRDPVYVWVMVVIGVVLLCVALSSSWMSIRNGVARLFKSDSRAFGVAVLGALLTVIVVCWLHVFVHGLVVTSAALLVRLDVQTAGCSEAQAFWILVNVSLTGLLLGGLAYNLIY